VAVIEEIHPEGVVVRNVEANRREWLTFVSDTGRALPVPAAVEAEQAPPKTAAAPPAPVPVQLSKAAVERHLANLSEVLDSALAAPHYSGSGSGRVMDGFEISHVRPGGAAHELGLRDSDVVLEVNGQPLNSLAAAMQLLGQARSLTDARLVVSRGGERMTFLISVR